VSWKSFKAAYGLWRCHAIRWWWWTIIIWAV
jgi:hypothetical protein